MGRLYCTGCGNKEDVSTLNADFLCSKCRKKKSHLKRKYNIELSNYHQILEKQDDCCAICKRHIDIIKRGLVVDHCHTTGEVRGLLCNSCNSGLGFFKDSIDNLKNAAKYLYKFKYEDKRTGD